MKAAGILKKARDKAASVSLRELRTLLRSAGFEETDLGKGSHEVWELSSQPGIFVNIQSRKGDSKMAKPYQVRQVVRVIDQLGIEVA